jgi:hypothetical protein
VIDQLGEDGISLTEMVLDRERMRYTLTGNETGVFTVTEPWPISIDLPALTARRTAILNRVEATP